MSKSRNDRRKIRKVIKENNNSKFTHTNKRYFLTIVTVITVFIIVLGIIAYVNPSGIRGVNKIEQSEGPVPSDLVCMVFDSYKGVKQIPIKANGVTYYGCCQGCIDKLNNNSNNVCFAIDPFSKKEVDKGESFIVLKPNGNGLVLYFESEANYEKFKSENN